MNYVKSWAGFRGPHVNALDNTTRAAWQSVLGLRKLPELTDLRALARSIRGAK